MSADQIRLWVVLLLAAVALDAGWFHWTRGHWRKHGRTPLVELWVRASARLMPALAWLKSQRPPSNRASRSGTTAMPTGDADSLLPQPAGDQIHPSPGAESPSNLEPAVVVLQAETLSSVTGPVSPRLTRVLISLEVPEGTAVRLTVEARCGGEVSVTQHSAPAPTPLQRHASGPGAPGGPAGVLVRPSVAPVRQPRQSSTARLAEWRGAWAAGGQRLWAWWTARAVPLETVLFGLALGVYLLTRLIGLERFPIYFFTDEAVQTNRAAEFVRDGFESFEGEFFPTYFKNGQYYNLSVSVYLQVVPTLLFGRHVWVTRGVSVLVGLLGAWALGRTLRDIFKIRYGWSAVLLLGIAPAWYLHSRTAFETGEMTALYACFLYAYLLYRYRSPRHLYLALTLAAATFYTYSPGQLVMLVTGMLLFLSDLRYHWQNRRTLLWAAPLAVVLAAPYLRFRLNHPEAALDHLRVLSSYWTEPWPLWRKMLVFGQEYLRGLEPRFWFLPHNGDLNRHVMKGYGNLLPATLPFALAGVILALRQIRSSAHRAILIALLAAPSGAALVGIGVTRALSFVVPATVLTTLGLSAALEALDRFRVPRTRVAAGLFGVLALTGAYMTGDALINGPTWFEDYGLYGMQYGARQLLGESIPDMLEEDPDLHLLVSPSWANGTDELFNFFLSPELARRVEANTVDSFLYNKLPMPEDTLLVMTPEEYDRARASPKFQPPDVVTTLPYPNGRPGFYVARLAYVDGVDAIFAAERQARRQLVEGEVELAGRRVRVHHSVFDAGQLGDAFDGDWYTLARGLEANPLIFELTFDEPRAIRTLAADFGHMDDFTLTLQAYAPGADEPVTYASTFTGIPADPNVEVALEDGPELVSWLRLEVKDNLAGEMAHIHVRELSFH